MAPKFKKRKENVLDSTKSNRLELGFESWVFICLHSQGAPLLNRIATLCSVMWEWSQFTAIMYGKH